MNEKQPIAFTSHTVDDLVEELSTFMSSEMNKLLEEPIVKHVIKTYKSPMSLRYGFIYDAECIHERMKRMKESNYSDELITKVILKDISCQNHLNHATPAITDILYGGYYTEGDESNVYYKFTDITVYLSLDEINRCILHNMDRLLDIYEYWKLVIRHELGHVIDAFHHYGHKYDEAKSQLDKEDAMYDEIDEKFEELRNDWDCSEENEQYAFNVMYFTENPKEKRANEYAGFTEEELELLYRGYDLK